MTSRRKLRRLTSFMLLACCGRRSSCTCVQSQRQNQSKTQHLLRLRQRSQLWKLAEQWCVLAPDTSEQQIQACHGQNALYRIALRLQLCQQRVRQELPHMGYASHGTSCEHVSCNLLFAPTHWLDVCCTTATLAWTLQETDSPPPDEQHFVDDDGTEFRWDSALRKFVPSDLAQNSAAAAAEGPQGAAAAAQAGAANAATPAGPDADAGLAAEGDAYSPEMMQFPGGGDEGQITLEQAQAEEEASAALADSRTGATDASRKV